MNILEKSWDECVGAYDWLKSLVLGEFDENRPLSVVVTDMLIGFVPGVVVVTSARDMAAVCIRLGKRYEGDAGATQQVEWQEWVLLIACAFGVFGPLICAAVGTAGTLIGTAVGALIGDEAAAFLRALCLLLIHGGTKLLHEVVSFLSRCVKGDVLKLLRSTHLVKYSDEIIRHVGTFIEGMIGLIGKVKKKLLRVRAFETAKDLIRRLEQMERRFFAVQHRLAQEIPKALAQLDNALQDLLKQVMPTVRHPAYAATPAPAAKAASASKLPVTSGVGGPPRQLPLLGDGTHAPAGGRVSGRPLPEQVEKGPVSANVHQEKPVDVKKLSRSEKGIYGEIVSDRYMTGKGHTNMLPEDRQIRSMTDKPRGRGIDGIYRNFNPPPPYIITETKFRTGGDFDADNLPTTKGSAGHPSAKQMSDKWIEPRLVDALGEEGAETLMKAGYDRWLIVVDENGKVTSITKLDGKAKAIGVIKP